MKLILCGFMLSGGMGMLAQVPDIGMFGPWLQYGALGILAGTICGLFWIIVKLIAGYKELADRWEGWEKMRHEDSEKASEALKALSVNCAAVNKGK